MTKIHTCRDIPDELVEVLKKDGIAMVDCEFTGLDVGKKGTDRLCLIQICNKESKEVYLVQPNKNFETPNLVKVLNDPNIQIVIHFSRKDKSAIENFLKPKSCFEAFVFNPTVRGVISERVWVKFPMSEEQKQLNKIQHLFSS